MANTYNSNIVESQFNETMIDDIQGGVIICQIDPATGISKTMYMSDGWTKLTGYTPELLEQDFGGNPTAIILPEDAGQAHQDYIAQINKGRSYRLQYRFRRRDGHTVWCVDCGVITPMENGFIQNQSILTDITPLMESEEKLRMNEMRFRIALKASNATVFEYDIESNTYLSLENTEAVFGVGGEEVSHWFDDAKAHSDNFTMEDVLTFWYHPEDVSRLMQVHQDLLQQKTIECETRLHRPDNSYIWCRVHLACAGDGEREPLRIIGHLVDVNDQHERTTRLLQEAQSDALTGLYNKTAVQELIEKHLQESPSCGHALLILDVDNFKGVNDSLGHLFGDAVLMDVSSKLKKHFSSNSILGRIGGDEFIVFLPGELTEEEASKCAAEICKAFRHTYYGEKSDYTISCSIGVALSEKNDSFFDLFRKADQTLYLAKSNGKDQYAFYSKQLMAADADISDLYGYGADQDSGGLKIKERIFELLYGSVDFTGSINIILSLLGQLLNASRISIFENTKGNLLSSSIFEWRADGLCAGNSHIQTLAVGEVDYFARFNKEGIFQCSDLTTLPASIRSEFEKSGVHSIFQVALVADDVICGFMSYDNVSPPLGILSEHKDIMAFAAKVTGTFIIKKHADESVKLYNENKMEALDVLPCGIYVIDEAYRLHYINNMTTDTFPDARLGMRCHEVFMHNDQPCANCPAARCQLHPCSTEIFNPYSNIHMVTSASTIRWSGRQDMRLICCQITAHQPPNSQNPTD